MTMSAAKPRMYRVTRDGRFTAERAWGATDIAEVGRITARLHWTDAPCKWHVNDGNEVLAVLDGRVGMHARGTAGVEVVCLVVGDVYYAGFGCEHVAHLEGAAHILVVEKKGSV